MLSIFKLHNDDYLLNEKFLELWNKSLTRYDCLKSMCECALVPRVFPNFSTRKKPTVCCSKNFCSHGGWKDEVWDSMS